MSSVSSKSSSSTSGQDEAVRKTREDYRKKEAELVKKHNRELRALNERYSAEIDRKDAQYSTGLKDAREKTQETLSQRDLQYRKETEELRSLHAKQLEKLMTDNRATVEAQQKASRLETKHAQLNKSDRTQALTERYESEHAAQEKKFAESLQHVREDQRETIEHTRNQLKEAHEKELDVLRDDRNEKVSELKNNNRRISQNTQQRLRDQEIRHMQDKARAESSHMSNLNRQATDHEAIQTISREGYQQGLEDVRDRMAQARERDRENQGSIHNSFKDSVHDRMDNQVNRLEHALSEAKDDNILEKTRARREAQTQVKNIRDAYQDKFNHLEKARVDTLRQSNEINAQNVKKVRSEADQQVVDSSRYYRERMDIERLRNGQALDSLEKGFQARQTYTAETADTRVDRLREEAHTTEANLRNNFKANVNLQREASNDEKRELRLALEKEKNTATQVMKNQILKQEVTHQRTLADTVAKYEKRIADMNEQFVREKRLRDHREKELINAMARQKQAEVDALQIQHIDQQKQVQLTHEREVKDLSRRNAEKLDEVMRAVKKSQV